VYACYFGYPQAHEHDAERAVRTGLALAERVPKLAASETLPPASARHLACRRRRSHRHGRGAGAIRRRRDAEPRLPAASVGRAGRGRHRGGHTPAGWRSLRMPRSRAATDRRVCGAAARLARRQGKRCHKPLRGAALYATPLDGRDEEIDLLLRRWQQAKAGDGRAVLISGEPGIGKSRLLVALSERIASEPHTRLRYFCSPHHQDSALYPFITQLERAAGFTHGDTVEQKLSKLRDLLASGATSNDEIQLSAESVSLPNSVAELNLSPQRKREMVFEALLHQLEALARTRPILFVFEDAHWVDPSSRELLDLTLERVRRLPVLLIVTFRPEFQQGWGGQAHVTILALNRLGERDVTALARELAGNARYWGAPTECPCSSRS
jgi:hypothetical protein